MRLQLKTIANDIENMMVKTEVLLESTEAMEPMYWKRGGVGLFRDRDKNEMPSPVLQIGSDKIEKNKREDGLTHKYFKPIMRFSFMYLQNMHKKD